MVCGSAEFMGLDDALQREHKRPLSRIITNKAITSKATKTTVEPFAKKPEKREEANIWVKSFQLKVLEISIWIHPGNYSLCFETLFPGTLPWPLGKVLGRKLCVLIKMAKLNEHSYTGVQHILHTWRKVVTWGFYVPRPIFAFTSCIIHSLTIKGTSHIGKRATDTRTFFLVPDL